MWKNHSRPYCDKNMTEIVKLWRFSCNLETRQCQVLKKNIFFMKKWKVEKFASFYRKKLILGARSALNIAADFSGGFCRCLRNIFIVMLRSLSLGWWESSNVKAEWILQSSNPGGRKFERSEHVLNPWGTVGGPSSSSWKSCPGKKFKSQMKLSQEKFN